MKSYTINYRDNEHDSGTQLNVTASDDKAAINRAQKYVEDGARNQAFASVEIDSGTYTCQNRHGKAIGQAFNH